MPHRNHPGAARARGGVKVRTEMEGTLIMTVLLKPERWRVGGVFLLALLLPGLAAAQEAGFSIQPGPNGPACAGSAVVDSVTYTCEEVEAWLAAAGGDTAELHAGGLPPAIQVFIVQLRDARRMSPAATPVPGGAP